MERIVPSPGAPRYALAELRKVAEAAVDEVTARVDAGRQNGDLKQVNRQYKIYCQQPIARAEKAMPYAKFIERFTMSLLRGVAVNGAAV